MAKKFDSYLDRLALRRVREMWRQASGSAANSSARELKALRGEARQMRRALDQVLHEAEAQLALTAGGRETIRKPALADWAWRPEIWRGPVTPPGIVAPPSHTRLGAGAAIFHDCARSELTLRQFRNTRPGELAPFGLSLEAFGFDGSFLSLVLDLPGAALRGLTRGHVIRVDLNVICEAPMKVSARLNVRHGPNTERLVRDVPLTGNAVFVEFDLAYTKMNEQRIEAAWLDLILEGIEMNRIELCDVALTRRPRSEI